MEFRSWGGLQLGVSAVFLFRELRLITVWVSSKPCVCEPLAWWSLALQGKRLGRERAWYSNPEIPGMVSNIDGGFILDNPRFVNRLKAFSLNDTELRIGDLMKPTVP